ncbi:amylo-alpha-1,6-glucosidase [Deinococcus hopiensis]|uniref:Glycogen debranching enzyme, putative n=1 Tax=Deinococcus hopiensis KR-140 TaxID=695939 RepID=A0A1W1VLH0_9DEIO|nr:amylo-alpha-1,6-glucosidase [Deinococcus hopiensis]SMB93891.1 glycogen debranching enzyme, putative [Deinococcus hopiensis KR-140]
MNAFPAPTLRTFGPQAARNPDLEVLLTDGLGSFALSSLAGVPTRCYSGLAVSHLPPAKRWQHLVSPLEVLETGVGAVTLHALELAPSVYEGDGLRWLSGATLRDLLPEREQWAHGVRVRRRACMPRASGSVVFLYDVEARDAVALTLGGFFADRDMHATHGEAPALTFETEGTRGTVRGTQKTWVEMQISGGEVEAVPPQPFSQRVYYRHDAARGEQEHERVTGAALWRVTLPPGGGRVALTVSGLEQTLFADPWAAYEEEAARRRALATRAQDAAQLPKDEFVATLAVAADAYLVRRAQPAGGSVIAGYPWFADWGRDAMIALTGLTLVTGRHAEARELLDTFLRTLRRGLTPNNFHDDGAGAGYNTVDGALWLAVALERYVEASGDLAFARKALPQLRALLNWHARGTDHGIGMDPADGLLLAGEPGVQLTWMDVKIADWVVTPRHGKPVEVQGLWLAALRAEGVLAGKVGEASQCAEVLSQAREGFATLWQPDAPGGARFADTLGMDGEADLSVRPNTAIAIALPEVPATPEQREATVRQAEAELLTPLGLHTLSPRDGRYRGNYGGDQVLRDAAYHQGTVWPWPLGAYIDLLLAQGEAERADAALDGLRGHLWEAGLGHVSEVFAGETLVPGGCPFQAWSVAEVLRAHVRVRQTRGAARPDESPTAP